MRLIDADKLKETLLHYNYTTEHNQIFRYINEQPTAYDIDKAIDDFVTNVKDELITDYSVFNTDDIRIFIDIIEEIAEQLKVGTSNE